METVTLRIYDVKNDQYDYSLDNKFYDALTGISVDFAEFS